MQSQDGRKMAGFLVAVDSLQSPDYTRITYGGTQFGGARLKRKK
jgi:hypothetical protein